MNTTSTSYCGSVTGNNYICNISSCVTDCCCSTLYNEFIDFLEEVKNKTMLMRHSLANLVTARIRYSDYLTEEELQEKQYSGRFWDIDGGLLYILVDNDTVIFVHYDIIEIFEIYEIILPVRLQGRHYDEY